MRSNGRKRIIPSLSNVETHAVVLTHAPVFPISVHAHLMNSLTGHLDYNNTISFV